MESGINRRSIITALDVDIQNEFMKRKATLILQDVCTKLDIEFDKLCDFLIKYEGVVIGSVATHCFDTTCEYNDIDIFIKETDPDGEEISTLFFNLWKPKEPKKSVKSYGGSWKPYDRPLRKWTLGMLQPGKNHFIHKKMDLTMFPTNVIQYIKNSIDIECTKIYFDGINWNVPFTGSILNYFSEKKTQLLTFTIGNLPYESQDIHETITITIDDNRNITETSRQLTNKVNVYDIFDTRTFDQINAANINVDYSQYSSDVNKYQNDFTYDNRKRLYDKIKSMTLPIIISGPHKTFYSDLIKYYSSLNITVNNDQNDIVPHYFCSFIHTKQYELTAFNMCGVYNTIFSQKNHGYLVYHNIFSDNSVGELNEYKKLYDFTKEQKEEIIKHIYYIYKLVYRILKYMSRGYTFTNITEFFSKITPINMKQGYIHAIKSSQDYLRECQENPPHHLSGTAVWEAADWGEVDTETIAEEW